MSKKKPTGQDQWVDPDDASLLTKEMLDNAEVFDGDVFVRRGRGRPKSGATKEQISVRIDRDVLAELRKAGPGWQSQISPLLRRILGLDVAQSTDQEDTVPRAEIAPAQEESSVKSTRLELVHDADKIPAEFKTPD